MAASLSDRIVTEAVKFVANGEGTYSYTFGELPIGAVLLNVMAYAEAVWDSATSASLEVGDADDADYVLTAVDLKATDLLATQAIDMLSAAGTSERGAMFGTATHTLKAINTGATRKLKATIAAVGAGSAGRTWVVVQWVRPSPAIVTV